MTVQILLGREAAAAACAMSITQFDDLRRDGRGPVEIRFAEHGTPRWAVTDLEAWAAALPRTEYQTARTVRSRRSKHDLKVAS